MTDQSFYAPASDTTYSVPSYPSWCPPSSVTITLPLTEERIRQIIREELARYFDEGQDVLAPGVDAVDELVNFPPFNEDEEATLS